MWVVVADFVSLGMIFSSVLAVEVLLHATSTRDEDVRAAVERSVLVPVSLCSDTSKCYYMLLILKRQ
jgi:hypothetical protein